MYDNATTAVIYFTDRKRPKFAPRHKRARRPLLAPLQTPVAFWMTVLLAVLLLAVDVVVVLYARQDAGTFARAFADIFAVMLGATSTVLDYAGVNVDLAGSVVAGGAW